MVNKRVFITGISGFVGSHLAKYLLDSGNQVYGLVRRRADGRKPYSLVDKNIHNEVQLIEGEITNVSSISFALDEARPDVVFHLAAQSYVPRSFLNPLETIETNTMGTACLLESLRMKELDAKVVLAGSSEEYGLAISSQAQYDRALTKFGSVFPPPVAIPELPMSERNPLRPMSPYAVSKVHSEALMINYHVSYGLRTVVARTFNTEGPGRGSMFVTSVITSQVMKLKLGECTKIVTGNLNTFRDWSHINDMVRGYCLLAEKGKHGEVYNQGSMRTNSVLTFILLSLESAGWQVERIADLQGDKAVDEPTKRDHDRLFGLNFEKTKVDRLMMEGKLEFQPQDRGIQVQTNKGNILIEFDESRFRRSEVPIVLSDCRKIEQLGFTIGYKLDDIIRDQMSCYLDKGERES